MDMSQYLNMFIEETKDHIQSLNDNLLKLEENPEDNQIINEIFRSAHTIKGMAGTMNFTKMQKLTHAMENVLAAARDGKLKINSNIMDILFRSVDAIDTYLGTIIATEKEGSDDNIELIEELNRILNVPQSFDKNETLQKAAGEYDEYTLRTIKKAYDQGFMAYKFKIELEQGCLLKSARAYLVFKAAEEFGEIIKSNPSVQDIEDEKFDFSFEIILLSKESIDEIKKRLTSIAEIKDVLATSIELGVSELNIAESTQQQTQTELKTNENKAASKDEKTSSQAKTSKTVRVDIERLDVLMNLVSELIIIKSRIDGVAKQYNDRTFDESIEYLERITNSLHEAVMRVRMVPVERVFSRFPRMMRDLSKELNKEFELIITGEDTEVDRTIVDELGDPLIHLLRNSADHGIEMPEERIKKGKPRAGTIRLDAYHDGNNVVIEVWDDGAGIDIERVKNKAIEKGLIKIDQTDLTDQEVIDLLFLPSFSTKEKVTNLSGRGVGLDVVKTKIEQLGGIIEVKTEKDKGTRFTIRLPLTLAIIQALLVKMKDEMYAIPLASIKEIIDINKEDIQKLQKNKEIIMLRNQVIPIKRLRTILDIEDTEDKQKLTVVVLKRGEKLTGLIVDSLLGQQDIVIKPLGRYLEDIRIVSGATILGDGSVAMILDPNFLGI